MKLDVQRLMGWAIPLAGIALAAFFVFNGQAKLQAASKDLTAAQADEAAASAARDKAALIRGIDRQAAVPADRTEEDAFLNQLRLWAADTQVKIDKWAGTPAAPLNPPASPTGDASEAPQVDPAIKSVEAAKGNLTLVGSYQGVREFLTNLNSANRLFTLSDMHWNRKDQGVTVTMTITRYIDPTLSSTGSTP